MIRMNGIKKNYFYNMAYQVLNLILPLVTVPILSRTLGAEQTGVYSYTYSIVNYFMIFGMLGISNYGNRKIAKSREDKKMVSKNFVSIYIIQFILNIIMLILYSAYIIFFSKYKTIASVEILFILSNMFDISWLYFGEEDFKKTVVRSIFVKIISLILIVLFVKTQEDLVKYTLIMSCSTFISQIILWVGVKKYIELKNTKITLKDIKEHINKILVLFIPVISYSIYKIMDKIMLGLQSNMEEVRIL